MIRNTKDLMIQRLLEMGESIFSCGRWQAYALESQVQLIAFNGTLGFERNNFKGWEDKGRFNNLSDAITSMVSEITGINWR